MIKVLTCRCVNVPVGFFVPESGTVPFTRADGTEGVAEGAMVCVACFAHAAGQIDDVRDMIEAPWIEKQTILRLAESNN